MSTPSTKPALISKSLLLPFLMVTLLFPLWGFANDITNPMVAAFKNILLISNFESSLVQFAFYGGYAVMAIPAAIFIKRFSYKKGILLGLVLYALGCLMFIPAGQMMAFGIFLTAFFVMTCGLSFLETTANPYILSLGDERTATRRLNLSQAFNPMGSICGMFVASMIVLVSLNNATEESRRMRHTFAKEGTSVHQQLFNKQNETFEDLANITSIANWQESPKLTKKFNELTDTLSRNVLLLDDANRDEIANIQAQIEAQPSSNKFATALDSVLVVLQLREAPKDSAAETLRKTYFDGSDGMQIAELLAREAAAWQNADADSYAQWQQLQDACETTSVALNDDETELTYQEKATIVSDLTASCMAAHATAENAPTKAFKALAIEFGDELATIRQSDLKIISNPYAIMGIVLLVLAGIFAWKLPNNASDNTREPLDIGGTLERLFKNKTYLGGVIAQTFYVGAQIMCWTFIIQYAGKELDLPASTAQNCNILAMLIFVSSRFICTFVLQFIRPGTLLSLLAFGGTIFTLGAVFIEGYTGLYSLIAVSACMSLMFPTIYGIALDGLGDDAKLGSAGLILAIGGGCLMPPMQAAIIDMPVFDLGFMELSSIRASFILPVICFAVILVYGLFAMLHKPNITESGTQSA